MRYAFLFLFVSSMAAAQVPAAEVVCVVGDSQSKGVAGAAPLWWQYLRVDRPGERFSVAGFGIGGYRCDQLETASFNAQVLSATGTSYGCTRLFIQCGVNDLMQSFTSTQVCGTTESPGPVRRMATAALAAGIPVVVVNVAPWGANAQWSAAKQTQTEAFNTCVASIPGVTVVDAYTALGQSGSPTLLNTAWDDVSGGADGLHWDTEGARALATAVNDTSGALP